MRHPDTPYVPEPEQPEEPETPVFPFYDVPTSAWYYTAVKYVYDNKLMDGVDTYEFAPNATLVWTIIARMSGVDTTGGNSWYAKAQEWVITNGISDGENPTAAITREEFVTMLWRLAGEPIYTGDLSRVPDAGSISTWAQNAMLWSYATGLTEGDENGALTPLATATRAQAAAMIYRCAQAQGKGFTGAWMLHLPFTDVPEWAYESVAWCYMNSVTTGVSETSFAPGNDCTRAQIVTFLWRAFGK